MNDKLRQLYDALKSNPTIEGLPEDYNVFEQAMADDKTSRAFFDAIKVNDTIEGLPQDYDTFSGALGLKKKVSFLDSYGKGKGVLESYGLKSEESGTPLPPLQLPKKKKEPVKFSDTLAGDLTISSLLQAQNKRPDYLSQKRDEVISKKEKEITDAIDALRANYQKKIETDPTKAKELNKEFQDEANKVIDLRGGTIQSEIESVYKNEDYEYLEKGDVKNIQQSIQDILEQPLSHDAKAKAIDSFKNTFMDKVVSTLPEYSESVKRELNDIIAKSTLLDEKGNPTVFGWKQEVLNKKEALDNANKEIETEIKTKYPDFYVDEYGYPHNIPIDEFKKYQRFGGLRLLANRMYENTLKLPDNEGSFWKGVGSKADAIKSAGISDLLETIGVGSALRKQAKGEELSKADQAIIDAYGILNAAENSEQYGKAFTRGKGIGSSIAWMEQFALTSGLGGLGSKTAVKLLGDQIRNRVVKNIVKGLGSAIARTPVLTGGYVEAIKRASGSPELTKEGVWQVDKSTIEPIWKAIGKGAYSNFSEAFSEEAGGFLAGTGIGGKIAKRIGVNKIPKVVRDIANTVGFQPLGELPEEYLATLMQTPVMGDQTLKEAFSAENIWETAVQVGLMTGALGSAALPIVIANNQKRINNKELIDIFGKDNISAIRNAIMNDDVKAFNSALKNAFAGKSYTDLQGMSLEKAQKNLLSYATSLAQERGARVAQEEITNVANEQTTDKGTATETVGPLEVSKEVTAQKEGEMPAKGQTKIEEEGKDAEGIRTEVESTGVQEGLEQGEEDGLRVRDDEKNGVEAPTGEEVSEIVVAPFYNTQVKSPEEADALRQTPEYQQHIQNIKDKASALGFEITDLSENIGHYTNDAGEKITELSNSITINGTYEQAQQLAAVLGATTPEVQETTIAGHYVKAGDVNHESDEVNIEVADFKGALAVLDEMDIDYTLNQSKNTIKFLDFSKGEDLDFKNKVITFANKLKEKGIRYGSEERRPTQSKLINAEERRGILGRLNEEAVQRGQGGTVLRGITEEATKRNEDFIAQREKVAQATHKANIEQQFRDEFGKKGVPQEQIDGALALLNARANSWASEQEGRTPEQYYQRISSVKGGEFTEATTPKLYQLPDGRQVMGMPMPEVTNGFYSPIEKRLLEFKQDKASVNKWKEIIGKGDEATFTGVMDWLNGMKPDQSLTKAEINQFMKDNRIEVVEVVKEDKQNISLEEKVKIAGYELVFNQEETDYSGENTYDINRGDRTFATGDREFLENWINSDNSVKESKDTKFSQYQLPGEKENYKEVLVTMPAKEPSLKLPKYWEVKEISGFYTVFDASGDIRATDTTRDGAIKKAQEGISEHRLKVPTGREFQSSHFDEPNILVHLRMNTRTDSEGNKVLFLEEIQSDWGQKGKKEGFAQGDLTADELEIVDVKILPGYSVLEGSIDLKAYTVKNKRTGQLSTQRAHTEEEAKNYELRDYNRNKIGKQLIPSAPFVTDTNAWVKLGLKTALKEAIKQGVDRIAWSTGTQQFERWGSEKVDWVKIGDKGWKVNIHEQVEGTAFEGMNVDEEAMWEKGVTITNKEDLRAKIKKNLSRERNEAELDKLTDRIWGRMQTEDEGTSLPRKEGMESFYGSPQESKLGIVGNIAKSLFKQEPKMTKMATKDVDIREKDIRESGVPITYNEARNFNFDGENLLYAQKEGGALHRIHSFFELNLARDEKLLKLSPEVYVQQHSITITPQLKAEVEKGQPLFQKGKGKPKGATETLADGRVVIHAMTRPDFSTMVHEIVHVFEKDLSGAEIATLEKWSGKKQGTKEFSEAFARAGERYFYDGKAPNEQLKAIFEKFRAWLQGIYQSVKGSPIEKKISPEVRKIFDRLIMGEETAQIPSEKASEVPSGQEQGEGGVTVPPKGETPQKPPRKAKEPKEREKAYANRVFKAEAPTDRLKALIEKKGLNYKQIPNHVSKEEADFLISQKGIEKMWDDVRDLNNGMPGAVRASILARLTFHYDQLGQEAEKEGNTAEAESFYEKALAVVVFTDSDAREAGRFTQYLGSDEITMMLSPKRNVERVKKAFRKQRDDKMANRKDDIEDKAKKLRKANEESVDDVVKSKKIKEVIDKIVKKEKTEPSKRRVPQERIKAEQDFRKKQYEILANAWKAKRDAEKSGAMGFSATAYDEVIADTLGKIFRSYVKQGYYNVEDILIKVQKEFKKLVGEEVDTKTLRKYIPKDIDGKSFDDSLEENLLDNAKDKLAGRIVKMLEDKKAPKNDPIKQMIDTLFGKVKEGDTKEKEKKEGKPAIEKIKEALDNKEEYAEVWEQAKEEVQTRIDYNNELSEEQKAEYTKRLDAFYKEIIGKPYTQKQVEQITRKAIEDFGFAMNRIIREHYTVQDVISVGLQEKLVDELGLTGEDAKLLADAVDKEFKKIATARKLSVLRQGMKPRDVSNPQQSRQEWQRLIELTNMGAFSDAEFAETYADAWGFPKLTPEQAKELERLAGKVYEIRTGFKQYEAVQDYLNYIARIPGIDMGEVAMGVWYANVLSGARTQSKNFLGNMANFLAEWSVSVVKAAATGKFDVIPFVTLGAGRGFKQGLFDFWYTMTTGYSPIRGGKIEAAGTLERWRFKGWKYPLNAFKYVGRFMIATDTLFYSGLKEFRAYELAMMEARKSDTEATEPSQSNWAKANEILHNTTERRLESEAQATEEGLKGVEWKKRVWELMEESRGETIVHGSADFASRGTYNYRPEGLLGAATAMIARLADWATIRPTLFGRQYSLRLGRLVVPFTRIIANVGNTAMDYTPLGYIRAAQGSMGLKYFQSEDQAKSFYRKLTSEERWRIFTKASLGLAAYTFLLAKSAPGDDGEEPDITITADGFGDYAKNEELKKQPEGWQQYSVKIRGKWYSYQYTPLFLILAPLGWLRDGQKYKKDKFDEMSTLDLIGGSMFKTMSAMSDMTWMATVAGFLDALTGAEDSNVINYFKRLGVSIAKGAVYPKFVEQTKQYIDDWNKNPKRYSSSFWGKILKDTPGMKNKFPVQYNAFGEPVIFDPVQMLESGTSDPYARYIAENLYQHGKVLGIPSQKETACTIYDDVKKIERQMDDFEYMDYVREIGLRTKDRIMTELMPKDLTWEEISKEVDSIKQEVRQLVKAEMFGWGEFRTENPLKWKTLSDNRAVQIPETTPVKWKDENGKQVKATKEEMVQFNKDAMNIYSDYMMEYLAEKPDKTEINPATGEFVYIEYTKMLWSGSKQAAKAKLIENRENTPK